MRIALQISVPIVHQREESAPAHMLVSEDVKVKLEGENVNEM